MAKRDEYVIRFLMRDMRPTGLVAKVWFRSGDDYALRDVYWQADEWYVLSRDKTYLMPLPDVMGWVLYNGTEANDDKPDDYEALDGEDLIWAT